MPLATLSDCVQSTPGSAGVGGRVIWSARYTSALARNNSLEKFPKGRYPAKPWAANTEGAFSSGRPANRETTVVGG